MINIKQEDLAQWQSSEKTFHSLLLSYPSSITVLGKALGVPHASNIIAVRDASEGWWPSEYTHAIIKGRERYDAGLIELAQGRVSDHFFLYSFPRVWPPKRPRSYFTYMGTEP